MKIRTDPDTLSVGILIALLATAALMLALGSANAHEAPTGWKYPWSCCSSQDCKMVDASAVREQPEGYVIQSTGEIVGYADKRIRDSPDGELHLCAHQAGLDAGKTICLYVPPKGF